MRNFKINAHNAHTFVKHLQLLAKLSTNPQEAGIYAFGIYEDLKRLEQRASHLTTQLCNGVEEAQESKIEAQLSKILTKVNSLLKVTTAFINRDPRGYALKIKESEAKELGIYTDMGGYGILAPEF